MTPQLDDKSPLIPQILKKDVLLCNGIQQCGKNAEEREKRKIKIKKKIKLFRDIICLYSETKNKDLNIVNEKSIINSKSNYGDKE